MKRALYLLIFCCVIGLSSYFLTAHLKPRPAMVDLLPADIIALVEYDNLSGAMEDWQRSAFGEKLHQASYIRFLELLGISAAETEGFKTAVAAFDRFINSALFSGIFKKKGVIALLPDSQRLPSDPKVLSRNLVGILQVDSDFEMQRSISAFLGPAHTLTTTLYQGESLTTFLFDGDQPLTCARHRGYLLCAPDITAVQRCIDQSLQRMVQIRSGLESNPVYQRLRNHGGSHKNFFLYVDKAKLTEYLPELYAMDHYDTLLPQHISFYHQAKADTSRMGIVALVRQEELASFIDQYQLAAPVKDPRSHTVSSETQLSFWTNWFKAGSLWSWGIKTAHPEIRELMILLAQRFYEITGKTADNFFDVFGSGFGVFINEQDFPHQSSRAMGGLSIEVRDREKIEALLKKLLAGLQVVSIMSEETEIVSVIMAGGLLHPAYSLSGNNLLIADNVELIEQELRRGRETRSLHGKVEETAGNAYGNGFLFVRVRTLVDRWLPVLTLLTRENREKTKLFPEKTRLLIEQVVIPLLTSLKSMETCHLRGYAVGDEVLLDLQYSAH